MCPFHPNHLQYCLVDFSFLLQVQKERLEDGTELARVQAEQAGRLDAHDTTNKEFDRRFVGLEEERGTAQRCRTSQVHVNRSEAMHYVDSQFHVLSTHHRCVCLFIIPHTHTHTHARARAN
jgi:hypothetical protein